MKKLLFFLPLLALCFYPSQAGAVSGDDARIDWSLGQPSVIDNNTSACTNQAVARYDWVLGQPDVVYDASATCTATTVVAGPINVNIDGLVNVDGIINVGNQ